MDTFRLEAPRSSNKIRKRTISGTLENDAIAEILEPLSIHDPISLPDPKLDSDENKDSLITGKIIIMNLDPSGNQNTKPSAVKQIRRNMSLPINDRIESSRAMMRNKIKSNIIEDEEIHSSCNADIKSEFPVCDKPDRHQNKLEVGKIVGQHRTTKSDVGIGGNSKPTEWIEEIDALKMMKNGTSFLKYGKWGAPHFRPFRLSQDNSKIIWFSKNKSKGSTQIDIKKIDKILIGQNTSTFQRHASPELARASFSIVYDKYKTLDVIARNQTEHNCWIQGLNALVEAAKKEELEQLSELVVRLKMTKIDKEKEDDVSTTKPKCSRERAVKDFTGISKIYNRLKEKSQLPKMLGSEEFEIVSSKLESLEKHLELIEKRIDADDLVEIDFLVHHLRAGSLCFC